MSSKNVGLIGDRGSEPPNGSQSCLNPHGEGCTCDDDLLVPLPQDIIDRAAQLRDVLRETSTVLDTLNRRLPSLLEGIPQHESDRLRSQLKEAERKHKGLISMVNEIAVAELHEARVTREAIDSEEEVDELAGDD